jgi:hypothetical protein
MSSLPYPGGSMIASHGVDISTYTYTYIAVYGTSPIWKGATFIPRLLLTPAGEIHELFAYSTIFTFSTSIMWRLSKWILTPVEVFERFAYFIRSLLFDIELVAIV